MAQPFLFSPSIAIGIIFRVLLHTFFDAVGNNDKLVGALCGVWDGVLAYTAYRTDRLLEPLVLLEVVGGVCFDALYTGGGRVRVGATTTTTPTRIVSLALGCVLGVLISDAMRLADVWEDLGEEVQKNLNVLEVEEDSDLDLDASSGLDFNVDLDEGSFSEDVSETIVYEERERRRRQSRNLPSTLPSILKSPAQTYPTHPTQTSPRTRTRKLTTAEWILAQRQAGRSSKSTSRRASHNVSTADVDADAVDLGGGVVVEDTLSLSLLDLDLRSRTDPGTSSSPTRTRTRTGTTRSQTRTQTESSRGRRDREVLASMTPLPGGTSVPSIPSIPSVPSKASRSRSNRTKNTNTEINIAVLSPSVSTRKSSPTIKSKTEDIDHDHWHGHEDQTGRSKSSLRDGNVIDVSKSSSPPKFGGASAAGTKKSDNAAKRETRKDKAESTSASMHGATRAMGQNHSPSAEYANIDININDIHRTPSHRYTHTWDHKSQSQSQSQSLQSRHTGTHTHTTTDPGPSRRSSFQPFIPPRPSPSLTRAPTVISAVEGRSAPSPQYVHPIGPFAYYVPQVDVPSFGPGSVDAGLREKQARSRASTVRSRSSAHRAGHRASSTTHVKEEELEAAPQFAAHSPAPEVVIDYSGSETRIYIPPPAETGINVRIVPRPDAEEDHNSGGRSVELGHRAEDLHSHDHLHFPYDILFPAHSIGSFPDLDSVPPPDQGHTVRPAGQDDDDDDDEVEARSHAEDLTRSSDPQPPSTFDFKTAWRNSGSAPPPSPPLTDYAAAAGGNGIPDDQDPLPVYISENFPNEHDSGNFILPEHNLNFNGPGPSSSAGQRQTRSRSHRSQRSRSRSADVASRTNEDTKANNTLDLDLDLDLDVRARAGGFTLPVQTSSMEWFRVGPAQWRGRERGRGRTSSPSRRRDHYHSHSPSRGRSRRRGRGQSDGGGARISNNNNNNGNGNYDVGNPTDVDVDADVDVDPLERIERRLGRVFKTAPRVARSATGSAAGTRGGGGGGGEEEEETFRRAHRYQPKYQQDD